MSGQETSRQQPIPTFTSKTELVTVPVVVLRGHSPFRQLLPQGWIDEHVTGLKKEDFEIEEDGQLRAVASFEEISTSKAALKPVISEPGVYTNELTAEGPVTMVVFLLDLINTPYLYQARTKKKMLEYLQRDYRPDRPTMLAVLHPSGLRVLHDFTSDPKVLSKVVRQLSGNIEHNASLDNQISEDPNGLSKVMDVAGEYAKIESEFMDNPSPSQGYEQQLKVNGLGATFSELQQLAQALSSVRGMKTLVWATGGLRLPSQMDSKSTKVVDEYTRTLRMLSATGMVVYPIDTIIETSNPGYSSPQSRMPGPGTGKLPLTSSIQTVQNFMDISHRTGGDYCLLRKDPDLCFRKAVDYDSQYYLLSYYTRSPETVRWRKIGVKVHGENLQVRARSGYFSAGKNGDPEERRKADIMQAFVTPVEFRNLPISIRCISSNDRPSPSTTGKTPSAGDPQLQNRLPRQSYLLRIKADALTIDTADDNHLQLDVVALSLAKDGRLLADSTQRLNLHLNPAELEKFRNGGLAYRQSVEVLPSTAKVRFIVRDFLSERIGSVSAPVETQP